MDALSEVLRVVRLSGGLFLEAEFTAPWCVLSQVGPEDCGPRITPPAHIVAYHVVTAGRLEVQVDDAPPTAVQAGQIVMLPRNDVHRLASGPGLKPVSSDGLVQAAADGGLARLRHGGGGEATRIVCGYLGSETAWIPLLAALPRILTLDIRDSGGAWIESSVRFAAAELTAGHTGSASVIARLSELLFAETVRRYVGSLPDGQRGWLAGLRDPVVGRALACLHERPAHPWTTEDLAREAGLSRSAFADRFTELIGAPPMRYLGGWRMELAARALRDGGLPIAKIAYEVGYESEAAFNRAFKRAFGQPPAAWRRQTQAQSRPTT